MEQEKLRRIDALVAVGSGSLTALLDVLLIKDIDLRSAHEWGSDEIKGFIRKVAEQRKPELKGKEFSSVINFMEGFYMEGDAYTDQFGGGLQHHLHDFSHHPTIIGWFFFVLMELTGKGFGTDSEGNFKVYKIDSVQPKPFVEAVLSGTFTWFFHLLSDMAGSYSTIHKGREGTGLPGPMLSALKMLSSCPVIKKIGGRKEGKASSSDRYAFSETCSKLFNGTLLADHDLNDHIVKGSELRFDLRTELGIVNESLKNKQYIPVVINELIVASFYSVSRFVDEMDKNGLSTISDLSKIDIKRCLPWNKSTLKHMRMIAAATFSAIDLSTAGVKAYIKNKDNKAGFALDFIQGINFWGLGDLALASNSEAAMLVRKSFEKFQSIAQKTKEDIVKSVPNGEEWLETAEMGASTAGMIAKMGSPAGFAFAAIGVYKELSESIKEYNIAKEERIQIEKVCAERIAIIQENQELIDRTVSDYFVGNYEVFERAFNKMDHAVAANNSNEFIEGNVMLQEKLDYDTQFRNQSEFDSLMDDSSSFKL